MHACIAIAADMASLLAVGMPAALRALLHALVCSAQPVNGMQLPRGMFAHVHMFIIYAFSCAQLCWLLH
jgi:hypothetical protein